MADGTVRRTVVQMRIVVILAQFPGLSTSEVAERVHSSLQSVTSAIAALLDDDVVRLENEGWYLTQSGTHEATIYSDQFIAMAEKAARAVTQVSRVISVDALSDVRESLRKALRAPIDDIQSSLRASLLHGTPEFARMTQTAAGVSASIREAMLLNMQSVLSLRPQFDFAQLLPRYNIADVLPANDLALGFVSQQALASMKQALGGLDLSSMFRHLREILDIDDETIVAFRSAGWPISPSMPRTLRARVRHDMRSNNRRSASLAVLGTYRRGRCAVLVTTCEQWASLPYFRDRMHIIRDALWAHQLRRYTLSVPALVPLIEGILLDFLYDVDPARKRVSSAKGASYHQALAEAFVGDANDYGLIMRGTASSLLAILRDNTYEKSDVQAEVRGRRPHRRKRGRHGVLHGIATNYHREHLSLRAFLILDAISGLIQSKLATAEEESK